MYLDDILVFGPDFGTTLARLESVLDRLGEAGLKLKAKNCQLLQEAHSGFHGASRPPVRVGDQGNGFRIDGTEARGIRAVEERPDQCADTRVSSRGRTVVP